MVMIFPAIWWGWAPPMTWVPFTEDPLGNLAVLLIPSLILGTAMCCKHHEDDAHHDAGGAEAGLYQDCLVQGSQGEGSGDRSTRIKNALIPVRHADRPAVASSW